MPSYDPAVCDQKLTAQGMLPLCGSNYHCEDVVQQSASYHSLCGTDQSTVYTPVQCTACTNGTTYLYFPAATFFTQCAAQGAGWGPAFCYCCCSCFANDTLIAIPEGSKQIYLIAKGEQVLAGSVGSTGGKLQMNWVNTEVNFSQGTGSTGHQPMMVYISMTGKNTHELICSMDQPFLLADGKYTTAGKLRPGQQLVDKDGNPVTVELVSIGAYEGGVHHIATDKPWLKIPDGHLLLAGGVVAGDFTMQLYFDQLPDEMKEDNFAAKPKLGTSEYETINAGKVKRSEVLFEFVGAKMPSQNVGQRKTVSGLFKTYSVITSNIPYGAQSLFTPEQAADIAKNGNQAPIGNTISLGTFNTIKKQFAGFYPDIDFYFDILDVVPNLYAFEAYGRKTVVVSGGLGRMQGFNYEGMFTAMAHGIACFYGGDPKNSFGYSGVGQADWYAFGVISKTCWASAPSMTYLLTARQMWNALFALVSPEHAQGNPNDKLNDPSLACRSQTIDVAIAGGNLPECAGGAPQPKISLEQAVATSDSDVVLIFSLALLNDSATNVANYTLTPAAKITSATLDTATGFIVHLKVDMKPGTQYTVTVQNLTSILGTGLDPNHVSAEFTSPKS